MIRKAVFFDRDDTLNQDPGYLHEPRDLRLKPHAGRALAMLREQGFLIIVISNQSGVGRGLFGVDAVEAVNAELSRMLDEYGAAPDAFYYCTHRPEDNCTCRKPATGLLREVSEDYEIDMRHSFMVGDKESDVEFGINAGLSTVRLCEAGTLTRADYSAVDIMSAAAWILSHSSRDN